MSARIEDQQRSLENQAAQTPDSAATLPILEQSTLDREQKRRDNVIRKVRSLHPSYATLPEDELLPAFESAMGATSNPQVVGIVGDLMQRGYPKERIGVLWKHLPRGDARDALAQQLLANGVVTLESPVGKRAIENVGNEIQDNEVYRDLVVAGMGVDEIAMIAVVEKFSNITDEEKLEEIYSHITKGMIGGYLNKLEGTVGPTRDYDVTDVMKRVPKEVFTNEYSAKYNMVQLYFKRRLMEHMTDTVNHALVTREQLEKQKAAMLTDGQVIPQDVEDSITQLSDMRNVLEVGLTDIQGIVSREEDEGKKAFLTNVHEEFTEIVNHPISEKFKQIIEVDGGNKPFPCFEQLAFAYYANKDKDPKHHTVPTRLLTADTGLGKTGAAFLAMEGSKAERVLIMAPAKGRQSWKIEEQTLFKNPGDVFIVNGLEDLNNPILLQKKYVVVGHEVLGLITKETVDGATVILDDESIAAESGIGAEAKVNGSTKKVDDRFVTKLRELVKELKFDGLLIDEIDIFANPQANFTKTVKNIAGDIRTNFAEKRAAEGVHSDGSDTPVYGLTATPIHKDLADLDAPMAILYPDDFVATVTEITVDKKRFSDHSLRNPQVAYVKLHGEERMFRWEKARDVQDLNYSPDYIEASPFERELYNFINDVMGTDALNKIRLLENALLNPYLVKIEVPLKAKEQNSLIQPFETEQMQTAMDSLVEIMGRMKDMKKRGEITDNEFYLSADKLVELGYGDMVLQSFFSVLLEKGIDTLVDEETKKCEDPVLRELRDIWRPRTEVSNKYQRLHQMLRESLEWKIGKDGVKEREAVVVVSTSQRQGRTDDVVQRKVKRNDVLEDMYATYELEQINKTTLPAMMEEWIGDMVDKNGRMVIDGKNAPVGKIRDRLLAAWKENPDKAVLMLTEQANLNSRSYTKTETVDAQGNRLNGIHVIYLDWPWNWSRFKQLNGRFLRRGHQLPVRTSVLHTKQLVSDGKFTQVRYTDILQRIILSGVKLNKEDRDLLDEHVRSGRIPIFNTDLTFVRDHIRSFRGKGENAMDEFITDPQEEGRVSKSEEFAKRYYDNGKDEYKISGHNAEFTAALMKKVGVNKGKIVSIGAGTLLLQRQLGMGIDNVDINPHIMNAGWEKAEKYGGRKIIARASQLGETEFPSGTYDAVESSFTLHWSKLQPEKDLGMETSERVKILTAMNRVLKQNGALILTLPDGAFDDESFARFTQTLEIRFGFAVDRQFSGMSFGITKTGAEKRMGWSIVAKKVGDVVLSDMQSDQLEFRYEMEKRRWVSAGGGRRGDPEKRPSKSPAMDANYKYGYFRIDTQDNAIKFAPYANGQILMNGNGHAKNPDRRVAANIEHHMTPAQCYLWMGQDPRFESLVTAMAQDQGQSEIAVIAEVKQLIRERIREGYKPEDRDDVFQWIISKVDKKKIRRELGDLVGLPQL